MSQTHAKPQNEEQKKHGDALNQAMDDFDRHGTEDGKADPVPPADQSQHAHSHAAHLGEVDEDTKRRFPDLRTSPAPGALRQPPMEPQRIGKDHRGQ